MARVTVEEPKSVVETVEKFECDECKAVVDEEEINTAFLFTGDRSVHRLRAEHEPEETKHLCDNCNGLRHALNVREKKEYLKARWEGFGETVNWFSNISFYVLAFLLGLMGPLLIGSIRGSPMGVKTRGMIIGDYFLGFILAGAVLVLWTIIIAWINDS